MINLELTPEVKAWLDTEPAQRDLQQGADLLLRITRNRILYNNIVRNLPARAGVIEYNLKKIYHQRIQDITHEEVREMMTQVDAIATSRGLANGKAESTRSDYQRGKRADHDELPSEIQRLYEENGEIMHRMRDTHTKIRLINPDNSTCPDSDRYPLAKYLIELDVRYRDNWYKYDHYIKGTPVVSVAALSPEVDSRTESANAARLCNLLLGQYAKSPSESLADRICEAYAKVLSPSERLTSKMREAELLQ